MSTQTEVDKTNSTGLIFTKFFDEIITSEGEFKEEYRSIDEESGFINYIKLAKVLNLTPGEVKKFFDKSRGCRIIAIGTRFGAVVLYDKYPNQGSFATIATHFKKDVPTLRNVISGFNIGERELFKIIGNGYNLRNNIGFKLESMANDFTE